MAWDSLWWSHRHKKMHTGQPYPRSHISCKGQVRNLRHKQISSLIRFAREMWLTVKPIIQPLLAITPRVNKIRFRTKSRILAYLLAENWDGQWSLFKKRTAEFDDLVLSISTFPTQHDLQRCVSKYISRINKIDHGDSLQVRGANLWEDQDQLVLLDANLVDQV